MQGDDYLNDHAGYDGPPKMNGHERHWEENLETIGRGLPYPEYEPVHDPYEDEY